MHLSNKSEEIIMLYKNKNTNQIMDDNIIDAFTNYNSCIKKVKQTCEGDAKCEKNLKTLCCYFQCTLQTSDKYRKDCFQMCTTQVNRKQEEEILKQ